MTESIRRFTVLTASKQPAHEGVNKTLYHRQITTAKKQVIELASILSKRNVDSVFNKEFYTITM
jgi:hypothetical protein